MSLRYSITVNTKDPIAMGVLAKIERRDVTGSSFYFAAPEPDDEEWVRDDPRKLPLRRFAHDPRDRARPGGDARYEATTSSARKVSMSADAVTIRELIQMQCAIDRAKCWVDPTLRRRSR